MMKCITPTSSDILVPITHNKSNIPQRRNNDTEIRKNKIMDETWMVLLKWVGPVLSIYILGVQKQKFLFSLCFDNEILYYLFKSIHSKVYHTGNKKLQNTQRVAFFIFIRNLFAIRPSIGNAIFFFLGGTWFPEKL